MLNFMWRLQVARDCILLQKALDVVDAWDMDWQLQFQ